MTDDADRTRRAAEALLNAQPRPQMDRVLAFLKHRSAAEGALIARIDGDSTVVELVRTMRPERIARYDMAWRNLRERLTGLVEGTGFVLAPLRTPRGLIGVLYLDAPKTFSDEGLAYYLFQLAQGLEVMRTEEVPGAGMPADGRALLLQLMEAFEWNISRVARAAGLTRRTIYLRLVRYGIPRRRVAKGAR